MSISSIGLAQSQHKWPSFQSTDTDGDGSLSLSEFSAIGQNVQGAGQGAGQVGNNGLDDNSIQQIFSAIDTDSDGKISRSEATTAFNKLSSAMQSGLLGAQEQFGAPPSPGELFASADSDGSGGLSFDEFKTAAAGDAPPGVSVPGDDQLKALFDKLDTNGDGTVSADEMKAAHKGHHRHHAQDVTPDQGTATTTSADPTAASNDALTSTASDAFMQATAAYNNLNQTLTTAVNQILDALKAA
jgi:Ca2+-binding EF-hand superfamily protein